MAHKLGTWQALSSPMDSRQTEENHQKGGHPLPNFCNGIQYGRSIKRERELLPRALEEEVEEVEDHRPIRAETKTRVPITLHRQHRQSPDLIGLDGML
jgi:hypothetical protein